MKKKKKNNLCHPTQRMEQILQDKKNLWMRTVFLLVKMEIIANNVHISFTLMRSSWNAKWWVHFAKHIVKKQGNAEVVFGALS